MKLFWSVVALLLCISEALIAGDRDQQAIIEQPRTQEQLSQKKLSDVIAASPLLSLHRAICEVESVTDNELDVGKLLISILEAHNFTVKAQSVPPPGATNTTKERFNIYAYPDASTYEGDSSSREGEHRPQVLLSSHIDTVPPHIPYSLSLPKKHEYSVSSSSESWRDDILISGRGTVDDKACVAVQLQTALDLLAAKEVSSSDIALLFVVGEEKRGDGMRAFSNSDLYDSTSSDYKAILFGEPTEGKLAAGHKGIEMLTVKAHGKAAHSGYPWLGRSANSMILPALTILDSLGDMPEEEGGLPRNKKYGSSTVNIGYMQGGIAGNVVPEFATADVTFRLAGGTVPEVRAIVLNAIHKVVPEGYLELEFTQGYGPIPLDADVDGFDTITVNYGTDVPNLEVKEGVKRYLYGPGSILVAHGKDEGLTVGDLEDSLDGYKRLVMHALKS